MEYTAIFILTFLACFYAINCIIKNIFFERILFLFVLAVTLCLPPLKIYPLKIFPSYIFLTCFSLAKFLKDFKIQNLFAVLIVGFAFSFTQLSTSGVFRYLTLASCLLFCIVFCNGIEALYVLCLGCVFADTYCVFNNFNIAFYTDLYCNYLAYFTVFALLAIHIKNFLYSLKNPCIAKNSRFKVYYKLSQ